LKTLNVSQKVIVYFFGKCSLQNLIMTISYLQFSYYTHVFVTCILIGCRHAWLHPIKILTVWLGKWGQGWKGGEGWILSFAVENDNVLKILCNGYIYQKMSPICCGFYMYQLLYIFKPFDKSMMKVYFSLQKIIMLW
jgi:hypothetical protein